MKYQQRLTPSTVPVTTSATAPAPIIITVTPTIFSVALTQAEKEGKQLSNNLCTGHEKRKLTTLPMKLEDFAMIVPYGVLVGGHVTPVDHQYFTPTLFHSPRDTYEVYAMADATLAYIEPRQKPDYTEYRLVFTMSCTLFYYYDLVTSLAPDIKARYDKEADGGGPRTVGIPVKAGQVIGKIGGQTLDFAVWDTEVTLKGFIVPEHYQAESWKIHTVDPLDYYTDDLKQQALSKYVRTAPPVSGKIDYDIDGKLIGNWFVVGTHGYQGITEDNRTREGYWKTHLAIVPDHIDPSGYIASFGDFGGDAQQFMITDLTVDPTQVDVSTGLIKYNLAKFNWLKENGEMWDNMSFAQHTKIHATTPAGCVLLQMLTARTLKMETFPRGDCQSISGFSSQAKVYER